MVHCLFGVGYSFRHTYMYMYKINVGMVESFQEVELGLPQFSDITTNGDGLEAASATSIKSEATEDQSQTTTASTDKPSTAVSSNAQYACCYMYIVVDFRRFPGINTGCFHIRIQ